MEAGLVGLRGMGLAALPANRMADTQSNERDLAQWVTEQVQFFSHGVPPRALVHSPKEYDLDYEEIVFPAYLDKVSIEGWYLPCKGSKKVIIANHPMTFNRAGCPELPGFGGPVNLVREIRSKHCVYTLTSVRFLITNTYTTLATISCATTYATMGAVVRILEPHVGKLPSSRTAYTSPEMLLVLCNTSEIASPTLRLAYTRVAWGLIAPSGLSKSF